MLLAHLSQSAPPAAGVIPFVTGYHLSLPQDRELLELLSLPQGAHGPVAGTVLFTTGSSRGIPGFSLSRCAAEVACCTNPVFMVDLYTRAVEFLFQGATEDAICLHVTVLTHLWALPGPSLPYPTWESAPESLPHSSSQRLHLPVLGISDAFGTMPKTVLRITKVLARGRFFCVSKVLCFLAMRVKP